MAFSGAILDNSFFPLLEICFFMIFLIAKGEAPKLAFFCKEIRRYSSHILFGQIFV